MRIIELNLTNVRLFENGPVQVKFDPDKKCSVLLGNNGAGKTTILNSLATMLSVYTSSFPGVGGLRYFTSVDIHVGNNEQLSDFLAAEIVASVQEDETITMTRALKGRKEPSTVSKTIGFRHYAEKIKNDVIEGKPVELPIVAYYNTERGNISAPERKRNFAKSFERWDCYKDSLSSDANFKRFFMWFDLLAQEELIEITKRQDFSYKSPSLEAVRRAISGVLGDHFANPRIEMHPLRFAIDETIGDGRKRELRIEQLSDGFRIMIALVADIAARMAEANPHLEDPLNTHGVVLIDEIDLHLHPQLQREILRKLTAIFPKVQFIVSTHSPNVIIGALDMLQLIKLENGCIDDTFDAAQFSTYDISLLLLSRLFNIDNVRTVEFKKLEDEEEKLISKDELSETELCRLRELATILRTYGYSNGQEKRQ